MEGGAGEVEEEVVVVVAGVQEQRVQEERVVGEEACSVATSLATCLCSPGALKLRVDELRKADVVVVACELLYNLKQREHEAYQTHLAELAAARPFPGFLQGKRQTRLIGSEPDVLTGVWVPNSSQVIGC